MQPVAAGAAPAPGAAVPGAPANIAPPGAVGAQSNSAAAVTSSPLPPVR